MIEKTLYVSYSYSRNVERNMTVLGWKLKDKIIATYKRNMKVITNSYPFDYKNEGIHELDYEIEEKDYEDNKEKIENYFTLIEQEFIAPIKYKFCLPIIIVSTAVLVYFTFILLWILTLEGGPFNNSLWAYIVYVITFGQADNVVVPTIVILILNGLFIIVPLILIIVFSIIFNKKKKKFNEIISFNEDLENNKNNVYL